MSGDRRAGGVISPKSGESCGGWMSAALRLGCNRNARVVLQRARLLPTLSRSGLQNDRHKIHAAGGTVTTLKNQNGVVINLRATNQGLQLNLSADDVRLKLAQ